MKQHGNSGIKRLLNASVYSCRGFKAAWVNEVSFRQEVYVSLVLIPVSFYLGKTAVQISLLIGSCLLLLFAELINSAIEAVVDRIGSEHDELSGRAKDFGSAAVLICIFITALVWISILIERLT